MGKWYPWNKTQMHKNGNHLNKNTATGKSNTNSLELTVHPYVRPGKLDSRIEEIFQNASGEIKG